MENVSSVMRRASDEPLMEGVPDHCASWDITSLEGEGRTEVHSAVKDYIGMDS